MTRFVFLLALLLIGPAVSTSAATMGDDGLHKQDWFALTFRDIAEDLDTAQEQGKRLVLLFEQRGCVYCKKLHEEVLSDPEIAKYVSDNFMVVQYNLHGDEEVIDLDGEVLTEKTAARKWRLLFTPTILFLPESASERKPVHESAVAIMPGAFGKGTFKDLFKWVRDKGYETDESFQQYHGRMGQKRVEAGVIPD
ncbi:thioredoxin family protein [Oricola cellulosilytica]|uniref:Thioredoxin n=1 Tax=Oricola cellulosilytica TaxID=1429082 RepID=A0A4R0PAV2_9HYPH|nr:thioredoxin family protein [Oricola cellulosilytica]TCD11955.1 thioredoxin [Oricola cellulosilytica]